MAADVMDDTVLMTVDCGVGGFAAYTSMFSVKVTYNGEIRRISFPGLTTFPTFDQLTSQLLRIFPLAKGYYLSRLLFSPDSRIPARILVAREVHSSIDYNKCILQFSGRSWPNSSLRFSLLDVSSETDGGEALGLPADVPVPSSKHLPHRNHSTIEAMSQPELPSSNKAVNCSKGCCPVTQVKDEITTLLRTFQEDLDRNLSRIFEQNNANLGVQHAKNESASTFDPPDVTPAVSYCPACGSFVVRCPCNKCSEPICLKCGTHLRTNGCNVSSPTSLIPRTVSSSELASKSVPPIKFGQSLTLTAPAIPSSSSNIDANTSFFSHTAGDITSAQLMSSKLQDTSVQGVVESIESQAKRPSTSSQMADALPPIVHYNTICDHCLSTVAGVRHKCLDCPDFDLCTRCITSGSAERHNPRHKFLEITQPGRVIVHTVFEDQEDASQSPTEALPVEPSQPSRATHNASCDLCDSLISGSRYKCAVCPDFDTCDPCFAITAEQHPSHSFIRISRADDYISRDDPLHRRHFAKCDVCKKFIAGVRYKCMHPLCPDFDLCERCETFPIPQHPDNHPMLKMKSPDTVIPTVYRVGQTSIVEAPDFVPESEPMNHDSNRFWEERSISTLSPVLRETAEVPSSSQYSGGSIASETNCNFPPLDPLPIPRMVSPFLPLDIQTILPPDTPVEHDLISVNTRLSSHFDNVVSLVSHGEQKTPYDQNNTFSGFDGPPLLPVPVDSRLYNVGRSAFDSVQTSDEQATSEHGRESGDYSSPPRPDFHTVTSLDSEAILDCSPVPQSLEQPPTRNLSLGEPGSLSSLCLDDFLVNSLPSLSNPTGQLSASFIEDVSVPDGEILAPGVTFVKAWRMVNKGTQNWPSTTKVVFVGGVRLSVGHSNHDHNDVHPLSPGQRAVIHSCELKAPDAPGKYTSYWRLQDDQGQLFGDTLWVEIEVADASCALAAQSLTSSSVKMPDPTSPDRLPSVASGKGTRSSSPTSFSDEMMDDGVSDTSSISMISASSSDGESDDALWADSRVNASRRPTPLESPQSPEYVVLFDDNTSEEAE